MSTSLRCLVTGSSGYIGGRLVPELLAAGYRVRCMARDPGKLGDRPWRRLYAVLEPDTVVPFRWCARRHQVQGLSFMLRSKMAKVVPSPGQRSTSGTRHRKGSTRIRILDKPR